MARINIEDSLFKDQRFIDLIIALGSRRLALGAMTECFIVAQKFWLEHKGIPKEEWVKERLEDNILHVGLATVEGDIIYVSGSKEQFKWLEQRSDAGRHKNHKNQHTNVERPSTTVNDRATGRNGSEPLTLTLSHSLKKETTRTKGDVASPVAVIVPIYVKAFQNRYGESTRPDLSGKSLGILKRVAKDVPIERLIALLQVYLQMEDRWFVTKCHDLATFEQNLQKISIAFDTGRSDPTMPNWGKILEKEGVSFELE